MSWCEWGEDETLVLLHCGGFLKLLGREHTGARKAFPCHYWHLPSGRSARPHKDLCNGIDAAAFGILRNRL